MVKRRDIISLLCMIAFSVPLIIYFFGGGLIVHADEPVPTSTPVPINSVLPSVEDNIITASGYEASSSYDSTALYNDVLASDEDGYGISSAFYDGDPTNGEAYIINDPVVIEVPDRNSSGADITNNVECGLGSNMVYFTKSSQGVYTITCINSIYVAPSPKYLVLSQGQNVISTENYYPEYLNGYQNFSSTSFACYCQYSGQLDLSGEYPQIVFYPTNNKGIFNVTEVFYSGENNAYGEPIYNYFGAQGVGYSQNIYFSNNPIYTVTSGSNVNTVLAVNGLNSSGEDIGSAILINVNYGSSGEESSTYPDGSGGDVTNNMYLETADWKFNIPKYWGNVTSTLVQPKYTANWGSGTVSFYGLCNDFIQDNSDDYKIVFNFYVKCNGHRFSDTHSEIDENFAKSFAWRSVEYDLADYVNNKSINVDFSVSDIFSNCWDQGMSTNVTNYLETIKTYNSIDNWDWSLSCDAQIVSGSYTSGSIQENYNFISQVSKEVSNTITQNNNPYYPEDDNGNPIIPDSDGTTSITDKNGQIILTNYDNDNNNQNVTINSNDKSVIDSLVGRLVPNEQGNGGLTQNFLAITVNH